MGDRLGIRSALHKFFLEKQVARMWFLLIIDNVNVLQADIGQC